MARRRHGHWPFKIVNMHPFHLSFHLPLLQRAAFLLAIVLLCWPHATFAQDTSARGLSRDSGGKRIALVIGNDGYANVRKLQKAGNDASAMARELKAAGFEVLLHKDLNYRGMVKAVETLSNSITGGDQVVVFFAGHGVQIKNGNYLLPIDIEANSENEIEKTAYALSDITDKLKDAKAAFALVMVDACRDNPIQSNGRSVGGTRGLSPIDPPKGQMVVFSASKGQQALDKLNEADTNPNGVFTREFIKRMKQPGLRVEDMVREVQDAVETLARTVSHDQRPAMYSEARGNFYFFGPTTVQVQGQASDSAAQALDPEAQTWAVAERAGSAAAYQAYLDAYPRGRYAVAAKIALAATKPATKPLSISLPAATAGLRGSDDPDTALWKAVEGGNAADDYSVYLKQYPKGKYVALARQRLKKLDDDARAKVQEEEQARQQQLAQAQRDQVAAAAREQARLEEVKRFEAEMRPGRVFKDCSDCAEMVVLPAGSFEMGENGATHHVTLQSFAIGKFEVTQGQWQAVMGGNPSFFKACGEHCPVETVSWDDVQVFIRKLNAMTGKSYRLPSEAEWEFSCRAGVRQEYCGSDSLDSVAWYGNSGIQGGNSRQTTHPVMGKRANAWGLYDMSGNGSELTQDYYHDSYVGAPSDGSAWVSGGDQKHRVHRGGSWFDAPAVLPSAFRRAISPDDRTYGIGFRLARTLFTP
jgi:formylglycine-generating enzyme required for sulfatase activity